MADVKNMVTAPNRSQYQAILLLFGATVLASCSMPAPNTTIKIDTGDAHATTGPTLFDEGAGPGMFEFKDNGPHPDEPINVYSYLPTGDLSNARILIVMPGRGRNAEEYRDEWLVLARRRSVILLVPEFPDDVFSVADYNLGNVVDDNGVVTPMAEWGFSVVEALFSDVVSEIRGNQSGYYLYGHSAGGQFVHRFMLFMKSHHVIRAVSANSGWYTVPDPSVDFPYGLAGGPGVRTADVKRMVGAPLTVLLGTEDNDPDADGLRSDEGSREQGATRLDRGFRFFRTGQQMAEERDAPFAWRLVLVNGVGHSNAEMAPAAMTELLR